MSACLETLESALPADPSTEARAARLAKFKREQLIVDYLNRGVPVAEIAAYVGVGEKRMRATIHEILARRMPHPPEDFVAIQVSRLNEAMLVAFSAMSGANLKAVDRVVKIARELDRYHGVFPAARRRLAPDSLAAPGLDALPEGPAAGVRALACQMGLALHDEPPSPAALAGLDPDEGQRSLAAAETFATKRARPNFYARFRGHDEAEFPATTARTGQPSGERPKIPPQPLEMVDFTPGNFAPAPGSGCSAGEGGGPAAAAPTPSPEREPLDPDARRPQADLGTCATAEPASGQARSDGGRENPTQGPENVDSGLGRCVPVPLAGSPSGESAGATTAAGATLPMADERLDPEARPREPDTQPQGEARPQITPQPLEIMDFPSWNGGLEPVAPPPPEFPVVGVRVPTPDGGFKIVKVRMTSNGVMAA